MVEASTGMIQAGAAVNERYQRLVMPEMGANDGAASVKRNSASGPYSF